MYFLVCVRKHKSNLPTNICTTVGKKTQWYVENATFWVKPHSCLILWQRGVFFLPKCAFFYQWCLWCFSSQQYASMIFVKQCWLKIHTLPRYDLIFPIKAQKNMKKRLEGAALKLPPGLTRPGPCEPEFWKNDLPANLFLLHVLPQKCNKVTPAFWYV